MANSSQSKKPEGNGSMAFEHSAFSDHSVFNNSAEKPRRTLPQLEGLTAHVKTVELQSFENDRAESPANASDGEYGSITEAERLERTESLLGEHEATVFRFAYRLCNCRSSAEDIAQEVFLRAFRSLHQLRDESAVRGWLLAITRNEFSRWCRKSAASGRELDPEVCENEISQDAAESDGQTLERNEWVEQALGRLPSEFRLVLLMYYFEELSYAEIAEQLKIPIGTVMSRLSRGKVHMKDALAAATK